MEQIGILRFHFFKCKLRSEVYDQVVIEIQKLLLNHFHLLLIDSSYRNIVDTNNKNILCQFAPLLFLERWAKGVVGKYLDSFKSATSSSEGLFHKYTTRQETCNAFEFLIIFYLYRGSWSDISGLTFQNLSNARMIVDFSK